MSIPSSFSNILVKFGPLFTAPTMENFTLLVTGWIVCVGRHSISRVIRFALLGRNQRHHAAFYRFFSRAVWSVEGLTPILLRLVLPLTPEGDVYALIDETLSRCSGPHIWGAGMHHDPLNSNNKRRAKKKVTAFAFGHSWVILSIWVPFPWNPRRGIAIPVCFRLYRSKKLYPDDHKKRTELAREMIEEVAALIPDEQRLVQVGDGEFSCKTCVHDLPERIVSIGTMPMNAAFYAFPTQTEGRGRPRKKGERLPTPDQLAADESIPWEEKTLEVYGRSVTFWVKSQVGLWYHVAHTRAVRMMGTRDPKGRLEDRAYFCTDAQWQVEQMATGVSRRWCAEVMHRDCKQHLGLSEPQNGWWRRKKGARPKKKAGPQPHKYRGKQAAERTVPLILVAYAVVVVWYLKHGKPEEDVNRVRRLSPWYRHKREPSFGDMLFSARRALLSRHLFVEPLCAKGSTKIEEDLMTLMMTP